MTCFADAQEDEPFISGHTEGATRHEGIPYGSDPDPRPAPLLLPGCHRGGQAHSDRQFSTGSSVATLGVNSVIVKRKKGAREKERLTLFFRSLTFDHI